MYYPLNEVYFGKTKEILEAEAILNEIREKNKNKPYNPKINVDPNVLKFNDKMASIFGFDTYALYIQPGATYNACTYPISYQIDAFNTAEDLVTDKNGFRFNENAAYVVITIITQGLLTTDKFTTPEIMAILLHEVGHNFQAAIDEQVNVMAQSKAIMQIILIIMDIMRGSVESAGNLLFLHSDGKKMILEIRKYIKTKTPGLAAALGMIESAGAMLNDLITNAMGIVDFFTFGLLNVPFRFIAAVQTLFMFMPTDYRGEKYADAFATAYGYGNELQSALHKFDKEGYGIRTRKILQQVPLLNHIQAIASMPANIICTALDEHPDFIERQNAQIRYLRKELQKPMDPKLKRAIQADLKSIEDAQAKLLKGKSRLDDPLMVKKKYWAWMLKTNDGDFKHNAFDGKYERKMDRAAYETQYRNNLRNVRLR